MARQFRDLHLPFGLDLAIVVGGTVLLVASWLRGPPAGRGETVLTSLLAIGYVFSVPGYALVAALFARQDESWSAIRDSGPRGGERIENRSRVILSIALSPIVVGVVAVAVDLSPLRLDGVTVLSVLAAFVLACVSIALARRASLPAGSRYRPVLTVPVVTSDEVSAGRVLFVAVAVGSVLVAGGSLAHTAVTWEPDERFTELSILTPGADGPVANGYDPNDPLLAAVENHEHREMDYTVVIRRQRVAVANDTATVRGDLTESRTRVTGIAHGDVRRIRINPATTNASGPTRLAVFLYRGSPPRNATAGNAYRTAYLRFDESDAPTARYRGVAPPAPGFPAE